MLLKEIADLNKQKVIPGSWIRRLKITMLPKVIYRFSAVSIKITMAFPLPPEMEKLILKFIWNFKGA